MMNSLTKKYDAPMGEPCRHSFFVHETLSSQTPCWASSERNNDTLTMSDVRVCQSVRL